MPQLGLGLGLDKSNYLKPLPKWLTDAGCTFAINVDRQVKALANPNSPLVNPLVDVVGKLGKNLFDGLLELGSFADLTGALTTSTSTCRSINFTKVKPNTPYYLSGTSRPLGSDTRLFWYDKNKNFISSIALSNTGGTATSPLNAAYVKFRYGNPNFQNDNIMLNEGSTQLPYEPYGFNNVLLQSFAGTTADGYTQIALPNGKNPWFLESDGLNSYGILPNTPDLDPTGDDDFYYGTYRRMPATLQSGYFISKTLDSEATMQYSVIMVSSGLIYARIEGELSPAFGTLFANTAYKIEVFRINGILKAKINNSTVLNQANTALLTSRPNARLNCRSNSVDGTVVKDYYKGSQGTDMFAKGAKGTLDETKLSKALDKLNANYI